MIHEELLRSLIRQQLIKEVYNQDLSDDDMQAMSNAIWSTLDTDMLVSDITRRCANAYKGSKRDSEAHTRMSKVINKGLEQQAEGIADAVMAAIGRS